MNHRENMMAVLRRQPFERIPFQLSLCESLQQEMIKRYGSDNVVEVFDMPVQYIELPPPSKKIDHRKYHKAPETLSEIDEWGVGYKKGSLAHFRQFIAPMADFDDPRHLIETMGAGGGLVIAPTHVPEPEVPRENIEALVQAVRDFGTITMQHK